MKTTPYSYQIEDATRLHHFDGRGLLASQMGTGKSLCTLLWAEQHADARPIIIVCPASLKFNWERECKLHLNWRADVLDGMRPDKHPPLGRSPIVIINYDILKPWLPLLRKLTPKLIVLDECHVLQGRTTLRTRCVRELCQGIPHVIALSGTPLVNRPAELWPTLNILRPDLFPSFWTFAQRFCNMRRTPWGFDVSGASRLPELHALLTDNLMIRRLKEDVLPDLKAKKRIVVPLDLSDRTEYDAAVKDYVAWLGARNPAKLVRAERAISINKITDLRQLVGRLKLPNVLQWVDNYLTSDDGKMILFGIHRAVVSAAHAANTNRSVLVDGSVTGPKRQLAVDRFQRQSDVRLFVGNIKAAGVGLNLTAAEAVVFAEYAWAPGTHTQAEDRPHRIGQTGQVTSYWLVARKTIEEKQVQLLQSKQDVSNRTLDGKGRGDELDVFDLLAAELVREAAGHADSSRSYRDRKRSKAKKTSPP